MGFMLIRGHHLSKRALVNWIGYRGLGEWSEVLKRNRKKNSWRFRDFLDSLDRKEMVRD